MVRRISRRVGAIGVLILILGLVLAGCGGESGETAASTTGESIPAGLLSGTHDTIDGDSYDLAQLEGQDVVLWFWAPW